MSKNNKKRHAEISSRTVGKFIIKFDIKIVFNSHGNGPKL